MAPLAETPGTIALPSAEIGRFAVFTVAIAGTQQPHGTYLNTMCSVDVTENVNTIIRNMRDEDAWVWLIGDDHVWPGETLITMLQTLDEHPEIDILVPLVAKRNPPWHLVLFHDTDGLTISATRSSCRTVGTRSQRRACSRSTRPAAQEC